MGFLLDGCSSDTAHILSWHPWGQEEQQQEAISKTRCSMPTGRSCNCSPGQTMQELTLPHALHMMEQVQHRQSILSVLGKPSHTKSATGLLYTGPSAHLARGAVLKTQCIQSVTADRPCTQCRKQYRQTDRQYRQTTQTDSIDRQHRRTVQTDSIDSTV